MPLRRFRYDAKHDILKCPRGRILRAARPIKHGRFFYSKARDCARCPLRRDCLSKGRVNKAVVVGDHYPALLRARRRRERWSEEDQRLYQRHRWRSEGFHGEAKSWHGLARAVRRGLANMKIQAYLTAAAINLKRLAAALLALLWRGILRRNPSTNLTSPLRPYQALASNPPCQSMYRHFFNDPIVHWYRNIFSHVPATRVREIAAMLKAIHASEDIVAAREKAIRVIDKLHGLRLTKAAELAQTAVEETLTYYAFPEEHWRRIRTNNPLERLLPPGPLLAALPLHSSSLTPSPARDYGGGVRSNTIQLSIVNVSHNTHRGATFWGDTQGRRHAASHPLDLKRSQPF